jgi:hypothetical protein
VSSAREALLRDIGEVSFSAEPSLMWRRSRDYFWRPQALGSSARLEDGARRKRTDADQLGFMAEVGPYGPLDPGKTCSDVPVRP